MTHSSREFLRGLSRAYGGALIFALPLFMTMEMWWLGFYMNRWRMLLLLVLSLPLLVGLSFYSGFRNTFSWKEDVVDALVAYAVGATTAFAVLFAAGVVTSDLPLREIAGKSILQAIPGSMGALLAQSQMGEQGQNRARETREPTYHGELFLMGVGALFMAFNIAPTGEIVVIAQQSSIARLIALMIISLAAMHGFVYGMRFKGHAHTPPGTPSWQLFARFTIPGYAIVLVLSAFMLWVFGRLDGLALAEILDTVIVLSVPGSIGAAAARLIL
jgi:putative integral membrane protein (TIGR02587 family)